MDISERKVSDDKAFLNVSSIKDTFPGGLDKNE